MEIKKIIKHKYITIKNQKRYVLYDVETGDIVDDAQGYGYKTIDGAYRAYKFKSLTDDEKNERENKIRLVKRWCKNNKSMINLLDEICFEIWKGAWGEDDVFDENLIKKILIDNGYSIENLGFTVKELIKYRGAKF